MVRTVVVAKYREDTSWAAGVENCVVLTKEVDVPNKGREPSTFLHFIVKNYDSLRGEYLFLQGNPFDHAPAALETPPLRADEGWRGVGDDGFTSDERGRPYDHKPVAELAEHLGLAPLWPVRFYRGGQFLVSAEKLRERPKEWYEHALFLALECEAYAWCYERLWGEIFR